MKVDSTIGFIGAGNMATALATGLIASGMVEPEAVYASDIDESRRKSFERATSATVFAKNAAVIEKAQIIVLAVKPQQMQPLLEEIGPALELSHLVISIAAGVTTAFMQKYMRTGIRLIRAMPNTPILVGAGAVGLCAGSYAAEADLEIARRVFGPTAVVAIVDEPLLDAVTAVSGSGPAYFFYLTEALIRTGVELGLSEDDATELARQTAFGAGKMLIETADSPEELRRKVTSPGGTTEAATKLLDTSGVKKLITDAVKAAAERSRELGEKMG